MTYETQFALQGDTGFVNRTRACLTEQALVFDNAADLAFKALADVILRNDPAVTSSFIAIVAASPGLADTADPEGDGTVDDALVTDEMLLATVQSQWPTVAALYFDVDGNPIGGTLNE
jgi:hypothetical protein